MEKYLPNKRTIVMSRSEVREFDSWAINTLGIPGVVLMENAGRSCAELIKERLKHVKQPKVCIFCGTGNNGGDGYVIARQLANSGFTIRVVICGDRGKVRGDAKINLDIVDRMRLAVEWLNVGDDDVPSRVKTFARDCDMLVDGLFGTGLTGKLSREYVTLLESINAQGCPIVAIDIPSGLDCDTGRPLGAAVEAVATVTFVAAKKGFAADGVSRYTGEIFVASIGVDPNIRED